MPGMPMMPMMPQHDQGQQQMQEFMKMQMQLMQNMIQMQQQQLGQTPPPMAPTQDYLGVPLGANRPMSIVSHAPTIQQNPAQGRAMTMMSPPSSWDYNRTQQLRPNSAMPNTYSPSMLNVGGPGPGYTPSIAPSERSNIGMPSRYRPVSTAVDPNTGRSQSLTSSMTLQAFSNQPRPESRQQKSTIRVIDKPKNSPKVTTHAVNADDDDDAGWAEMAKKRQAKKFSWRKKDRESAEQQQQTQEPALSELYRGFE
jgi:hypothetical protein